MELSWIRDEGLVWDEEKQRVIGGQPAGVFDFSYTLGAGLAGDWWSAVSSDENVVGYGWLDSTWGGDAEVLLAVAPEAQSDGVGSFILNHLEDEACRRGLNYVYNTLPDAHPNRSELFDWLVVRGYAGSESGGPVRKRVGLNTGGNPHLPPLRRHTADPTLDHAFPPGHEESGGYVDLDEHQY